MYGTSTQYKNWTFKSEAHLAKLRTDANRLFVEKFSNERNISKEDIPNHFLSPEEERELVKYYETSLKEFCNKFRDPRDSRIRMPVYVTATSQHYFKRFYLYNSVMDYHPKEIVVTCVYLACKIEEFYVTIGDFIHNVKGDKRKAADVILNNELQLTQELKFNLIVHQPFKAVEGLFLDLKVRFPELTDPDRLRPAVDEFLEKVHLTDAVLLFSPSQIAVAAVTSAVSKLRENLDRYVTSVLFKDQPEHLKALIEAVRKTKRIVKNFAVDLTEEQRKELEKKIDLCRNPENNPDSPNYGANYFDLDDEDDDLPRLIKTVDSSPIEMTELPSSS